MGITLNLDFAKVVIYENYLVTEVFEDVLLRHEHHDVLDTIAETYFSKTPFVYISHRVHSYSVDPMIYFRTSKMPNLAGFAFVSQKESSLTSAQLEQMFIKKPNGIFNNLEDAIAWSRKIANQKAERP